MRQKGEGGGRHLIIGCGAYGDVYLGGIEAGLMSLSVFRLLEKYEMGDGSVCGVELE